MKKIGYRARKETQLWMDGWTRIDGSIDKLMQTDSGRRQTDRWAAMTWKPDTDKQTERHKSDSNTEHAAVWRPPSLG